MKYSKGFVIYSNEEAGEMLLTTAFFEAMQKWCNKYKVSDELDREDDKLSEQGIYIEDDKVRFDSNLTYSRFFKILVAEEENLNNPNMWMFSSKDVSFYDFIDFSNKDSAIFQSKLVTIKFYVLRKVDEVAYITSRYVHCPVCGAHYIVPSTKIDFQTTYRCENMIGEKECGTALKKFPARKMIPTYIYEISTEVKSSEGIEYKEYFLESFQDLMPGFYSGLIFCRTEQKQNTFYFMCLKAHSEKTKHKFLLIHKDKNKHKFFDIVDSIFDYMKEVGFVLDNEKARIIFYVEVLKKITVLVNRDINLDHSLYFGSPGIGKSVALTLLHHALYPNAGYISGPRFSLPGLTGGQKEVFYQDTSKKKNVPGLFSLPAFMFDEINNEKFLHNNEAVNLFKSTALAASGNAATVGGKEFMRLSLVAGTANYSTDHLRHYENKIRKIYTQMSENKGKQDQSDFLANLEGKSTMTIIPDGFDFYLPMKDYDVHTPDALRRAILRVRDEDNHYLTDFAKPMMERFYWTIIVHPRYDRMFMKQKSINVIDYLRQRNSIFNQREKIAQLFIHDFSAILTELTLETWKQFNDLEIEHRWSTLANEFLFKMTQKYPEFFSMFKRIEQVHVYTLFALTLVNQENELTYETKRIFERLISLCHTPITIENFHNPNFEEYVYVCETRTEILDFISNNPCTDIRQFVDYDNRTYVKKIINDLETSHKIIKIEEYKYKIDDTHDFEEVHKNEIIEGDKT